MEKRGELSDLENEEHGCWCQTGLSVGIFTTPPLTSMGCIENHSKKRNSLVSSSCGEEIALLMSGVRGQTITRVIGSDITAKFKPLSIYVL